MILAGATTVDVVVISSKYNVVKSVVVVQSELYV
jgi:hypothetical protein